MGGFCTAGERISVSSSAKKGWMVPLLLQSGGGGSSTAVERMDGSFTPRERVSGFTTRERVGGFLSCFITCSLRGNLAPGLAVVGSSFCFQLADRHQQLLTHLCPTFKVDKYYRIGLCRRL